MLINKLFSKVVEKPWQFLLVTIILLIVLFNIKPNLYLIGWDNYSSYFNLPINLFRTFFSTWREYRGLGVPSDSESVDIFRQLFYLIISPFVNTSSLDQIYILTCLIVGVLGMYYLTKKMFEITFSEIKQNQLNFVSFIAAFFYLFNLGTLAVFYFPMIMYINRFAALPILFYTFFSLIKCKQIKFKYLILACVAILMTSVSYLTATIFITMMIFLPVFSVLLGNYKRQILLYALFIGLNLFWLIPFANYTFKNAELVKVAPTFIEANEIQMNKPDSFYRLDKLLLLYPNFFDDKVSDLSTWTQQPYHPDVSLYNSYLGRLILLLFPFLYLLGTLLIILKYRKRNLLWVPIFIFIAFIFVGKSYSPVGFIYNLLDKLTPYIGILFRFADTKFNAFISFAGSISVAVSFYYLSSLKLFTKKYTKIIFIVPILLTLVIFSAYFRGNLLGFFMYNKIPQAYFDIAEIINHDKSNFRILHLPIGRSGYWKPYVWGMNGSSFLHFMFNKPLIDRTFEPASSENSSLNKAILDLTSNAKQITDEQDLGHRATQIYELLQKTGVKYIILDKTINNNVYSKGVKFAGEFNYFDDKRLVDAMKKNNQVHTLKHYEVNILEYLKAYPKQYHLSQSVLNNLESNPIYPIELLELNGPKEKIFTSQNVKKIDYDQNDLLDTSLVYGGQHYVQQKNSPATIVYPFQRTNLDLADSKSSFQFELANQFENNQQYFIHYSDDRLQDQRYEVEVYVRNSQDSLILSFQKLLTPFIQNRAIYQDLGEIKIPLNKIDSYINEIESQANNYFSNWHILNQNLYGNLRLSVNNQIIPLPKSFDINSQKIATLLTSGNRLDVQLLAPAEESLLDTQGFQLTDNPNCFGDQIQDYTYNFENNGELKIISQNGSTCVWSELAQYLDNDTVHMELELNISAKGKDLDNNFIKNNVSNSKPLLKKYISSLDKPNLLRICIQGSSYGDCLNQHQILSLQTNQTITIPLEKTIKGLFSPTLILGLKNITYQQQEIVFNKITLKPFVSVLDNTIPIPALSNNIDITIDPTQNLTINIPKALSSESFYFDKTKDGFELTNNPCEQAAGSYRTFRIVEDKLLSYFENCSNNISIYNHYSSDHFYLWNIDYHLFSGKYPRYSLEDGFYFYANDFLSLSQGYPDIFFFKDLQKPEGLRCLLNPTQCQQEIKNKLNNAKYNTAYSYIYPKPELGYKKNQLYSLEHHSENEGILSIQSFDILELPNYWYQMAIERKNSETNYVLPQQLTYHQLLPSLWKMTIQKQEGDIPILLVFNESYNNQWGLYNNMIDMLLGKTVDANHVKYDGYANAWELKQSGSYFIFYSPEKLAMLGWIGVILTVTVGFLRIWFFSLTDRQKN